MPALASMLRRAPLAAGAVAVAMLAGACIYTSDAALTPPTRDFYFPTGVVVSPGRSTLYVINSDFDLQFNGGTVQTLSLDELRPKLLTLTAGFLAGDDAVTACGAIGVQANGACSARPPFICSNDILNPGPCSPIVGTEGHPLVKSFATIGAFASGAILVQRPLDDMTQLAPTDSSARLFVPVRGDPSITFLDIDDDRDPKNVRHPCGHDFCLSCDEHGGSHRCGTTHKMGEDPFDNTRVLVLPTEPIGIAASTPGGEALVAAHDTSGAVSLSTNDWQTGDKPALQFVLGSLPTGPTEVAAIPAPAYASAAGCSSGGGTSGQPCVADPNAVGFDYQPGFLVTYRQSATLDLMRYSSDAESDPKRPFLTRVAEYGVIENQDGKDSRGIAVDDSQRRKCEAKCADDHDCLLDCLKKWPLRVFIANRSPASLLVGEIITTPTLSNDLGSGGTDVTGAIDEVRLYKSIPLDTGPSHVALGQAIDLNGELVTRVFAVCFDTRFVFMYDPDGGRIEATFRTGRGPQAMALDTAPDASHSFLFVAHFTDSYLGVIDLDMRDPTFGTMFATLGEPLPPRESK